MLSKIKLTAITAVAAVVGLAVWPLVFGEADFYYQIFGMACFYGVLAIAWNIYALSGAISLGHAAFFGLGAYGSALLCHYGQWSPVITIPLGAATGAAFGVLWGVFFRNLRGVYLGLATLASVEIPKVIIDNWGSVTFGSLGIVGIASLPDLSLFGLEIPFGHSLKAQYYLLLLFLALAGLIHYSSLFSRWGWALRAIRENETAAVMAGVDIFRRRFEALILSSYLTGLCGALYAHLIGLIEPALVFNLHISALPLVLSIFGGRFALLGPVLGALILYPLDQLVLQPRLPTGHEAVYGLVLIMTIFFFPKGVATWLLKPRPAVWK
ncbi:MAG: branched-chain amino acid ABC transporter permease [Deltaproteobacteria bacterium]|nr:branched-chain amino acid ABC transporter permease [Deltaproteobacteria bacterium]